MRRIDSSLAQRIQLLIIVLSIASCGPAPKNPSNPTIGQSVVPAIQEVHTILDGASTKLNRQHTDIVRLGSDVDMALEYSRHIRSYTQLDKAGINISNGLDHSLESIRTHQLSLIDSNELLLSDIVRSSNTLQMATSLAILKDKESLQWQEVSKKKDQFISELNSLLKKETSKSTKLQLDLKAALVYKHAIMIVAGALFLFGVIKVAISSWSPFSKLKV